MIAAIYAGKVRTPIVAKVPEVRDDRPKRFGEGGR